MRYWHSSLSMHSLDTYILSLGLRPGDLLAETGLPGSAFINSSGWIERNAALQLVNSLARSTGDPLLCLHQSRFFDFEKFGAWGQGILSSPTLRDAIRFASRGAQTVHTGTRIHCARADKRARLWVSLDGPLGGNPDHYHQSYLVLMRMLIDLAEEKIPADVSVACAGSLRTDDWELVFGSRLKCGLGVSFLEFDAAALDLKLAVRPVGIDTKGSTSDEEVSLIGRQALDLVRSVICYERPDIVDISASLGLNLRTFQRQLDALGLTFRQLVDEYRQACALCDLSEGHLSVTEIAFHLGYSDSAHFTRAVRRWTGCCPRELRNRPIPSDHWLNRRFKLSDCIHAQRHALHARPAYLMLGR